jgi:2-alkenal reductase
MRQPQADASESSTETIYTEAAPSVVQVLRARSGDAGFHQDLGLGTGFVWDASGHIVTNSHVAGRAGVTVIWPDGGLSDAVVVGKAPHYDIAILRIAHQRGAAPLPHGWADNLKVGRR